MAAQLAPGFLVDWVRSELEAAGEAGLLPSLVSRALDKEPEVRFASMNELERALEHLGEMPIVARAASELPVSGSAETLDGSEPHG